MKQHITKTQFDEISFENKKKLFRALFPVVYSDPRSDGTIWAVYDINPEYLTIGRMIEFLKNDYALAIHRCSEGSTLIEDVCDALWEAVKEKLGDEKAK